MKNIFRKWSVGLLLVLLLSSGCSALPFVGGPSTLALRLEGEPEMNSGGNAAVVRVYQLTGRTNFERTPLATFWKNDTQALGNELVSKEEVLLYPEEMEQVTFEIDSKTRYVGVAADLRNPDQEHWRAIHPVDQLTDGTPTITISTDRVSVEVE